MNVLLCHYRVGETDGVSLEMDKWKKVLEEMGHKVYMLAGSKGTAKQAFIINEMEYRDPYDLMLERNAYISMDDFKTEEEFIKAVNDLSDIIYEKLKKIIVENKIDVIVPNNILSIGRSISTAIAFARVIKDLNIPCVNHHHDFFWERENFANPTCDFVKNILKTVFPPEHTKMKHVVINKIAKNDLFKRRGIESVVVPNVFDFHAPLWLEDKYNKDFKESIGLKKDDIFILQATRVTDRKAIELAIDVVAELNKSENRKKMIGKKLYDGRVFNENSEYILVLVGMIESVNNYGEKLKTYAKKMNVNMIFVNEYVDHSRHEKNGKKIYSLWDAYVQADIVTYPSIYEGWGNQFLEGIFAKKPQVVFEYSVFTSDIKEKGFHIISLGNKYKAKENGLATVSQEKIENAAKGVIKYLIDKDYRENAVEENFKIAKKEYSLQSLKCKIEKIFNK